MTSHLPDLNVTFIGNATTVISYDGISILTDPNFLHAGQHAYLGYGLLSKRLKSPALTIDELPQLDAVVLSHLHGDHWDRVAERGLSRDLPVVTTNAAARTLRRRGFARARGLDTWDEFVIAKGTAQVRITSLPGRHAPTPVNRLLPPVMGTMLEFGAAGAAPDRRLYISGDTLLVDELNEIPLRFNAIDAGILHLGGTRLPAGARLPFGLTVTMDAEQGVRAVELLKLGRVIPVHFDDYGVFASPLSDFVDALHQRGLADRLVKLDRGQSCVV